jgi:hypothetical protein
MLMLAEVSTSGGTMAAKEFWTAFVDVFTFEGLFGDLRLPDEPTRMFKPEPEDTGESPSSEESEKGSPSPEDES